jgi:hypothetical protein
MSGEAAALPARWGGAGDGNRTRIASLEAALVAPSGASTAARPGHSDPLLTVVYRG